MTPISPIAPTASSAPFHNAKLPSASLMRALTSPAGKDSRCGDVPRATQFEFHIVNPSPLLSVSDLAEEWDYCEQHIIDLIEDGTVFAFTINAEEPDRQKHPHYRIVRPSAVKGRSLTEAGMVDLIQTVDHWLLPVERFGRRQVFRVDHCADALLVTPRHVRRIHEAGNLGGQDLGTGQKEISLRVPRAELVAFVARRLRLTNNLPEPSSRPGGDRLQLANNLPASVASCSKKEI